MSIALREPHQLRPIESQSFERSAWVECVLTNPKGPDLEAYLARRFSGEA